MWTENVSKNQRFRHQQSLLVCTCYVTPRKTHFMCTKRISEKHFKIKDLIKNKK